ncbi:2,4-dihydroxyhept-2-ene-1,7-dioic acid aldolase [Viridothelium virens]|uniref:2,4-dihydroxyhept-2-ene-1,7-dioic acid aldolase n=1 Tax=Viridothelium virens TaxID=1048519 RepID=A0A6A6H9M9_VIRVR|nr:2,4-dihydroxyhept-2-ene-1,7-dioic acid aldolase [Viridothelium virens]
MQNASRIFKAFQKGGPSFGAWQMLPGRNVSRALASSGLDWICVDCEHGNVDDAAMHEAVAAIASTGTSPLVRIPGAEGWMVKRALDSGAHGVVVPLLQTAAEVTQLVRSAKFPPRGVRGFGSPFPMGAFSAAAAASSSDVAALSQSEYLAQANEALLTIIQIETAEALGAVDEIAEINGVDVLFVGPYDLGINIGHPIVEGVIDGELGAAIETVRRAAAKAGKKSGFYCTSGAQSREYAEKGFDMVSIAADMQALPTYMGATLRTAKGG